MIESQSLNLFVLFPAAGAFLISLLPKEKENAAKYSALFFSSAAFLIGVYLYFSFDSSAANFAFYFKKPWITFLGANYFLYADGLALILSLLTALLSPLAVLSSFSAVKKEIKWYYASLLILESAVLGVFCAADMLLFYVFWEAMLIPMYFLIGVWGGENRIYAALKFFIYTMAASLFMLAAIIILFVSFKTQTGSNSFSIFDFQTIKLAGPAAYFCFFSFLAAFAVKVPVIPLHTWLPDAHVQAPTAASVMLAGVLLKMGIYGFLRFMVPLFPELSVKYAPYLAFLGAAAAVYASLTAWAQKDLKKLIAYSSVAHMGLIVLGIMSFNPTAAAGAVFQSLNHGVSTGALFLLVGIIYERRHTRLLSEFGGLFSSTPIYAAFFMITALSSIGLPGLNGFVGEFMIFSGSFSAYPFLTAVSVSGVILSAIYMLSSYEKIFYGPLTKEENSKIKDLNLRELAYLLPLIILMFYMGLYPSAFLKKTENSVKNYCLSVLNSETK
ncbi:MAG: NADH-quinone oxidoreductase subunit M [Elusimicrobia bacterium]|nr:NADH-quinone oxidoreductase subunit M [Elusimicrobiota bacterium]